MDYDEAYIENIEIRYESAYFDRERAEEAWLEEVFEWAREMGLDPEDYDHEDIEKLSKEYREERELAMAWDHEVYMCYKERD